MPYGDINDLVKKELNRGRKFTVSLRRLRATWAVEVIRAVPREVAVAAIGTTQIGEIERMLRVDPSRPDTVEDHVGALTHPYIFWPGLAASEDSVENWAGIGSRAGAGDTGRTSNLGNYPRTGERKSTPRFSFEVIDGGLR